MNPNRHRLRWGWHLFALLAIFYFSPYTRLSSETGPAEKSASIYYHFGGLVSVWEILLLAAIALLVLKSLQRGELQLHFGPWLGPFALMLLIAGAFIVGLLHSSAGPLSYGLTETKRPLIAFAAPLYMFSIYLIAINSIQHRGQLFQILRWLDWLTFGLCVYGVLRLVLLISGEAAGMWFFGLPIVLYDQMLMLYVPTFTICALSLRRQSLGWRRWAMLFVMLFFILTSTRRFNYILLAAGIILLVGLGLKIKLWRPRRLLRPLFVAAVSLGMLAVIVAVLAPKFMSGVETSIQTLNVLSRVGQKHGGEMRLAEVKNLFANLNERPYAYLTGFGLGTLWRALEPQPVDPLTRRLRLKHDWYTQFHLPYLAMIFRLGIIGSLLFCLWLLGYAFMTISRLRMLRRSLQPAALAMLAFLILTLPAIIDSFNPTSWTLCGLYAALLEKLPD